MQIKQITDENFKNEWDDFVIENSSPASFLQSWEYSEFVFFKTQNLKFGFFETDKLVACVSFFKKEITNDRYFLKAPKGLILSKDAENNTEEVFDLLVNKIKEISKREKIIFFRIAPPYKMNNELGIINYEFIKPKILVNLKEPENTLILDLKKSEEELLKAMHQKTRYNIHLAEKKGVRIKEYGMSNNELNKNIDIFYNLIKETAKRDKINIFNKEYYKKLLLTPYSLLLIAEYKNLPLASIILICFGDTATYFYGASSNEKRNLMPNYLIQWEAIKWAKKNNYKYYDFWGIEKEKSKGNWAGITRFKRGFANNETGKEINFIGTFDYILNKKWYNLFRLGKIFKFLIPFRRS
ncbi:peptidoglycan bridge formation glycyltransferase FemA/FemB family protein [Candidatus Parcubacteria bacterium]|nr:peptidoglycan bridge formation glycyltransferase FemA/FemB family protein [Patescibacteria group bacterium]MBU4481996.1 peptidoglycan bridge formation glycyltransferase FemA/FemB family protein [Patescibacteria group bacterium]MCG2686733.1 peptidoglycan bridge formation glycyltransferase FemA/FemB family protein [Candidatus Parcubacteria bacterium]